MPAASSVVAAAGVSIPVRWTVGSALLGASAMATHLGRMLTPCLDAATPRPPTKTFDAIGNKVIRDVCACPDRRVIADPLGASEHDAATALEGSWPHLGGPVMDALRKVRVPDPDVRVDPLRGDSRYSFLAIRRDEQCARKKISAAIFAGDD